MSLLFSNWESVEQIFTKQLFDAYLLKYGVFYCAKFLYAPIVAWEFICVFFNPLNQKHVSIQLRL